MRRVQRSTSLVDSRRTATTFSYKSYTTRKQRRGEKSCRRFVPVISALWPFTLSLPPPSRQGSSGRRWVSPRTGRTVDVRVQVRVGVGAGVAKESRRRRRRRRRRGRGRWRGQKGRWSIGLRDSHKNRRFDYDLVGLRLVGQAAPLSKHGGRTTEGRTKTAGSFFSAFFVFFCFLPSFHAGSILVFSGSSL